MWTIGGHQIQLSGGPYTTDYGAPQVMVFCSPCPGGESSGWNLWSDSHETGAPVRVEVGVAVVARHLRESGIDVSAEAEAGAIFMGQFSNEVEDGLSTLSDYVSGHTAT